VRFPHAARDELIRLERGGTAPVAHHVLAAPARKQHAVAGFELEGLPEDVDVRDAPVNDVHAGMAAPVDAHAPRRGELQTLEDRLLEPNEAREGSLLGGAGQGRETIVPENGTA
jgi:hypothetical protein